MMAYSASSLPPVVPLPLDSHFDLGHDFDFEPFAMAPPGSTPDAKYNTGALYYNPFLGNKDSGLMIGTGDFVHIDEEEDYPRDPNHPHHPHHHHILDSVANFSTFLSDDTEMDDTYGSSDSDQLNSPSHHHHHHRASQLVHSPSYHHDAVLSTSSPIRNNNAAAPSSSSSTSASAASAASISSATTGASATTSSHAVSTSTTVTSNGTGNSKSLTAKQRKRLAQQQEDADPNSPGDQSLTERPGYSYAKLAAMAIDASPSKRCTVAEIYSWIEERFPFYRNGSPWWKNCIRHNLSMKKSFSRIPCGSGNYWTINAEHYDEIMKEDEHHRRAHRKKRKNNTTKTAKETKEALKAAKLAKKAAKAKHNKKSSNKESHQVATASAASGASSSSSSSAISASSVVPTTVQHPTATPINVMQPAHLIYDTYPSASEANAYYSPPEMLHPKRPYIIPSHSLDQYDMDRKRRSPHEINIMPVSDHVDDWVTSLSNPSSTVNFMKQSFPLGGSPVDNGPNSMWNSHSHHHSHNHNNHSLNHNMNSHHHHLHNSHHHHMHQQHAAAAAAAAAQQQQHNVMSFKPATPVMIHPEMPSPPSGVRLFN